MDISIRSVAERSAVSGWEFEPGDRVWSCLFRSPEGYIERIDVLQTERDEVEPVGSVLCRWGHTIKVRETSEADVRRAALQSADDIFLSLFDETERPDGEAAATEQETSDRLKFFLALQLERKRVLKPLGGRRFKHVPSGREITVPEIDITPELLTDFQKEISLMGGGL